jgi:hypothetical protein
MNRVAGHGLAGASTCAAGSAAGVRNCLRRGPVDLQPAVTVGGPLVRHRRNIGSARLGFRRRELHQIVVPVGHEVLASRHSFLAYLVEKGRFYDFVHADQAAVSRAEFADYLAWVAGRIRSPRFAARVDPIDLEDGIFVLRGWFDEQPLRRAALRWFVLWTPPRRAGRDRRGSAEMRPVLCRATPPLTRRSSDFFRADYARPVAGA